MVWAPGVECNMMLYLLTHWQRVDNTHYSKIIWFGDKLYGNNVDTLRVYINMHLPS